MREGIGKSFLRHPDPSVFVRSQLGCLRMRFVAVKNLGDSLTFFGGKRRHIDQRFYALLISSRDHCTGIGVPRYNHGTFCPGDRPVQYDDIVAERGERERRGNDLQSLLAKRQNDFIPTRSIRPSAMGNNHRAAFSKLHAVSLPEKFSDTLRDKLARILKGEVARVDQVQLCVRNVPLVGLRSFHGEEWIVRSPDDEHARLFGSEVLVPAVVKCDIRLIVVKKLELNGVVARAVEKELVERIGIRIDPLRVFDAMGVLKDSYLL